MTPATAQTVKSYRPEVIADQSGQWTPNSLRFATADEAGRWVYGLSQRWILVRDTRVVASPDEPNYRLDENGLLVSLGGA